MEFSATSPRADAILEGTFIQPGGKANGGKAAQHDKDNREDDSTSAESVILGTLHPQEENDSLNTQAHCPLHLQKDEVPDLLQMLVDSFRYTTTPDVIPAELTPEKYHGKLKVWDKKTSTSPTTDMHLGHLKAYWAEHTLLDGSPEVEALEDTRQQILEGHLLLINYALHTGYSYAPWQRIVNTMLEKDLGIPKIQRL